MRRLFFFLLLTGLVTYATMPDLEARTRRSHHRSHRRGGRGHRRGGPRTKPSIVKLSVPSLGDAFRNSFLNMDNQMNGEYSNKNTPPAAKTPPPQKKEQESISAQIKSLLAD